MKFNPDRRSANSTGEAHTTYDKDPGRVGITVRDPGAEATASLTPRQARHLAIRLLAAAERSDRKEATAMRKARLGERAKAIAREMLGGES